MQIRVALSGFLAPSSRRGLPTGPRSPAGDEGKARPTLPVSRLLHGSSDGDVDLGSLPRLLRRLALFAPYWAFRVGRRVWLGLTGRQGRGRWIHTEHRDSDCQHRDDGDHDQLPGAGDHSHAECPPGTLRLQRRCGAQTRDRCRDAPRSPATHGRDRPHERLIGTHARLWAVDDDPIQQLNDLRPRARRMGIAIRKQRPTRASDPPLYRLLNRESGDLIRRDLALVDVPTELFWIIRDQRRALNDPSAELPEDDCPSCRSRRVGFFRFCTTCGFDYEAERIPAPRLDTRTDVFWLQEPAAILGPAASPSEQVALPGNQAPRTLPVSPSLGQRIAATVSPELGATVLVIAFGMVVLIARRTGAIQTLFTP